jgi:hypothetical protein
MCRLGLASHDGSVVDLPTSGSADQVTHESHCPAPGLQAGDLASSEPLVDE